MLTLTGVGLTNKYTEASTKDKNKVEYFSPIVLFYTTIL